MAERVNEIVRSYWEKEVCGTGIPAAVSAKKFSPEWFEFVERNRYQAEPFIHAIAQFTRYSGKKVLEVGVGAGTDHVQWARAGAECYGVDLTDAAIQTTSEHLRINGLTSRLTRLDAEELPFKDEFFDVVYSWGVIHHSNQPERIISEIYRVLKPNGTFIGMIYGRKSVAACRMWIKYALFKGRPWRSTSSVISRHVESHETKAYTIGELNQMFDSFRDFETEPILTLSDTRRLPRGLTPYLPNRWGWFVALRGKK